MTSDRTLVYYSPSGGAPPELISTFASERNLEVDRPASAADVLALVNRAVPACLVLDARNGGGGESARLAAELKNDPFTSLVPIVVVYEGGARVRFPEGLQAGADEVITDVEEVAENRLRLNLVLQRAARDVNVHPTTRLPGTVQIERDLAERMASGQMFAVCYADLDHFKEFNDRYGYASGDRVILLVSRILRDLVRVLAPGGFVGHIGGDDFIFNVPLEYLEPCCDDILQVFDELIPYQYTEEDRQAGYFLGKDRRGSIHRIPLMTLSIGVVTNQFRRFTHTAEVSSLAGEMKTYAKSLPGSVYVVDRRQSVVGPGRGRAV
ncbi:MAG: diguanylate cyclase [Gemmatimonadota bacterium]